MAGNIFCPMLLGTIPVLRMLPAERVATMWSGAAASKQQLVQVRRRDDFCKRHSAGASVQLAVPVYGKDVLSVSSSLHLSKTPGRHEQVWQEWQKWAGQLRKLLQDKMNKMNFAKRCTVLCLLGIVFSGRQQQEIQIDQAWQTWGVHTKSNWLQWASRPCRSRHARAASWTRQRQLPQLDGRGSPEANLLGADGGCGIEQQHSAVEAKCLHLENWPCEGTFCTASVGAKILLNQF